MESPRFASIYILPFAGLILLFKLVRLSGYSQVLTVEKVFRSTNEDAFLLAFLLLLIAGGKAARVLPSRSLGTTLITTSLLSLLFAPLFAFEVMAQLFFSRTGATFDYTFFAQGLPRSTNLFPYVLREMRGGYLFGLLAGIGYYLLIPQIYTIMFFLRRGLPHGNAAKESLNKRLSRAEKAPFFAVALLLAFSWIFQEREGYLSRTPLRNASLLFLQTAVEERSKPLPDAAVQPAESLEFAEVTGEFKPVSKLPKRNIVLILLESVRSISVSHYNPKHPTTPFFDELAKQSRVFERAYSVVPHTSKALVSAVCGIVPSLDIKIKEAQPGRIPVRCLPDLLRPLGYRSAYFQSATEIFENRRTLVSNFGFDEFYPGEALPSQGMQYANYFGFEDYALLGPSEKWLRANSGQPFFVSYMTNGPHSEYAPLRRFAQIHFVEDEQHNQYLNSIHALDLFLRELFMQYKRLGLYENTVFIISGDHGEGMREHGIWGHGYLIYDEGVKVPMLVHDPKAVSKPKTVPELVSILDILPTVAELVGHSVSGDGYAGISLLRPSISREIFMHCLDPEHCGSTIQGFSKYVQGYNRYPEGLFNLKSDPGETRDLVPFRSIETEIRRKRFFETKSEIIARHHRFHSRPLRERNAGIARNLRPYRSETELLPQFPMSVRLAPQIELIGYSLNKSELEPMDLLNLNLHFKISGKIKRFAPDVHIDSTTEPIGWRSRPLANWDDPSEWPENYYVIEPFALHVPVAEGVKSIALFWKMYAEFPGDETAPLHSPWWFLTKIPAAASVVR